jgi:cytochrome c peroxidase
LLEVLDHYSDGIVASPSLDKRLEKGIQFTPEEKLDVISFLLTLSDKQFLSNPDFIIPR